MDSLPLLHDCVSEFVAPGVHVPSLQVPRHVCVLVCEPVPVPHDGEHVDHPEKAPQ